MSYYIIYKTTCLINNKIYVGKHRQDIFGFDGYYGSGKLLKFAMNKYGEDNFVRENLEFCTSSCLNEQEIHWINELSSYNPEYPNRGYNLTKGGDGCEGRICSNETKNKISKSNKGKVRSEETKNKMSCKAKGRKAWNIGKIGVHKHSEQSKRKISEKLKGRLVSEETRKKISDSQLGEKNHRYGKVPWNKGISPVQFMKTYKLEKDGIVIEVNNLKKFCLMNKFKYSSISSGYYINKNKRYKGWLIKT